MQRLALLPLAGALLVAVPACRSDSCDAAGNICTWAGLSHAAFNGEDEPLEDARFYWPIDMKITSTGDTYILDWNNHRVRHLTAEGTLVTVIGTDFIGDGDYATADLVQPGVMGTEINLNHPTQILERSDGSLILVSWHNHKLRHYDPASGMAYVMGGRGAGYAGDGGPLADPALRFNQPSGGALDRDGNIYLIDQRNQIIRRISADLKVVSTIAGTPTEPGYSGDGGDPMKAKFNFPKGSNPQPAGTIAIDADGALYIADTLNHAIRRISADRKTIETVVGTGEAGFKDGPAAEGQLNNPRDLEFGPDDRLYIADELNHRVRALDLEARTIVTIAGTGEEAFSGDHGPATRAALNRPTGLEFDDAGVLYIADSHNNRIRTVASASGGASSQVNEDELAPIVPCDPAPGRICTFAGTGTAGLGAEGLDARQTELYLPQDVTIGADKLVYVVDWNNHRIRKIEDGISRSVVGTGELGEAPDGEGAYSSLNHPTHMSVAPNGKLVIAAWHNSKLMEFDPATEELVTICGNGMRAFGGDGGPASMALLDLPSATAFDAEGNMYITDQANQRIRVVDTAGIIRTFVGNGMPGFSGDGGPAEDAQIKLPGGQAAPPAGRISVDKAGNLYIADSANNRIRMVDKDGTISTIAGTGDPTYGGDGGPATKAQLSRPSDVEVDAQGNLYIADTDNSCIRKIDADGTISTIAGKCGQPGYDGDGRDASEALLDRPYGVALDGDGNIYVTDTHNHRVRVIYK